MKNPQPIKATVTERPTATDVLASIVDLVLAHRYTTRAPNLGDIVRVVGAASRCLRYDDLDAKFSTENAVTMQIAKARGLVA